ncbi:PQQ-like domain-containing protein [Thiohalospira halophila DSM 15071]|uniref:PQQ-like domain-containing protein n=1 Tax=Thiohalospira halophila DSM 15071 TaxID=1123397 RepID=A0A1I1VQ67_9GAMM|nr:PQQ-binding-like beta-propeller repeat protein [Thiohalospira halophila]SFD85081.1 PQQ-like domain-containing protein [Thiohalospira halophila DSM 15071]
MHRPDSTPLSRTLSHLLATAGLLAALGGLTGCDDENAGDTTAAESTSEDSESSDSEETRTPTISDISAEDSPILPGGQVTVSVEAEGDALEHDWDLPEDWSDSGSDSGTESVTLTAPVDQAAEATISVTVENSAGSTSSEVTVATQGPAIESFDVDPLPGKEGDTATFTTDAYNRDGAELTYDYRIGGTLGASKEGAEWKWTAPEMAMGGRYLLEGIVTDSDDLTATAGVETTMKGASAWPAFGGDRQRSGRGWPTPDAEGAKGNKNWVFEAGNWVDSSPAIGADGTVYVGSDDSKVYALDPGDSSEQWAYDTGDWIKSSPIIGVDDTVYVGSNNGNVYALDPNTGDKEWAYKTGDSVWSSPAIGADGTVYVGSYDTKVYAIE